MHMMNNVEFMENLLEPYGPQLSLDQLVIAINKLFHAFDAEIYDNKHREIYEQLPSIWKEMSKKVTESFKSKTLRILDFGCGTGFEAQQLLRNIPGSSIVALTCYDPSPEMLEKCRKAVSPLFPDAIFSASLEEVLTPNAPYTLLVTNSVLHHLPDATSMVRNLLPWLDSNAMWLAGHEPSLRFFKNSECVTKFEAYLQARRWSPRTYAQLLKEFLHKLMRTDPYTKTAREAIRMGLFKQRPPELVIGRLIDFHVANSIEEMNLGRGFDYSVMEQELQVSWRLVWLKTYSFMGPVYEGELKGRWARSCQDLARRFPKDGANFSAVWQRV